VREEILLKPNGVWRMGKILDFKTKYVDKVLAIEPSFSTHGRCGYSLINLDADIFGGIQNKPFLHKCGVLEPFSSESSLGTMNSLCKALIEVWRSDNGYCREPMVIVVGRPIHYSGSPVSISAIEKLNVFVGMLLMSLSPKTQISPNPNEWRGNQTNAQTEAQITALLDFNSMNALMRELNCIKMLQRHNVFDAIGLGLYGARVLSNKISRPEMIDHDKDAQFYDRNYGTAG
jgi:hypothetical protein